MKNLFNILFVIALLILSAGSLWATSNPADTLTSKNRKITIFLDCDDCDFSFVRKEFPQVDYVRDPGLAKVHIIVTDLKTAGGGQEFKLNIRGRKQFDGTEFNLTYISEQSATDDEIRHGLVKTLKLGLVPYLAQTDALQMMDLKFKDDKQYELKETDDPWKNWVFRIETGGELQKEKSQSELRLTGSVRADKITEAWKYRMDAWYELNKESYEDDGELITKRLTEKEANGRVVKSLSERLSTGIYMNIWAAEYKNTDFGLRAGGEIEYNIFPWSECHRKIFTIGYRLGLNYDNYREETIYNKYRESHAFEAIRINLELVQPWGNIETSIEGSHYFFDFSKNNLSIESDISVRLSKILSLVVGLQAESTHDQLYLAKGDASLEDILLKRRKLATTYEIQGEIGLRFTFGSVYNNIVNLRL